MTNLKTNKTSPAISNESALTCDKFQYSFGQLFAFSEHVPSRFEHISNTILKNLSAREKVALAETLLFTCNDEGIARGDFGEPSDILYLNLATRLLSEAFSIDALDQTTTEGRGYYDVEFGNENGMNMDYFLKTLGGNWVVRADKVGASNEGILATATLFNKYQNQLATIAVFGRGKGIDKVGIWCSGAIGGANNGFAFDTHCEFYPDKSSLMTINFDVFKESDCHSATISGNKVAIHAYDESQMTTFTFLLDETPVIPVKKPINPMWSEGVPHRLVPQIQSFVAILTTPLVKESIRFAQGG